MPVSFLFIFIGLSFFSFIYTEKTMKELHFLLRGGRKDRKKITQIFEFLFSPLKSLELL